MAVYDATQDFAKAMSQAKSTNELRKLAAQRDLKLQSQYESGTYDKSTTPSTMSLYNKYKSALGGTSGGGSSRATAPTAKTSTESTADYGGLSSESLQQQIANQQKQSAINAFKSAFETTKAGLSQQESDINKAYRTQEIGIGTQDVMARKALENRLAQQGLSASGAVGQGEIAQNVLTQGALTSSRESQGEAQQAIANQLAEAQRARDLGIAGAESAANIAQLQQQLANMQTQQAQSRQDALATLGAYSQDYQARINQLQNDGDPSNDWQIPYLQQARTEKIATQEAGLSLSDAQTLWKIRGVADESIAGALGIPVGSSYAEYSGRYKTGGGAGSPVEDVTNNQAVDTQDEQVGYQQLATLFAGNYFRDLSPVEQVQYVRDNLERFNNQYTSDAVSQFISDTAGILPSTEEPVVEEPTYSYDRNDAVKDIDSYISRIYPNSLDPQKEPTYNENVMSYLAQLIIDGVVDEEIAPSLLKSYNIPEDLW